MTLSCVDLKWPELFQIVTRTLENTRQKVSKEEVDALFNVEKVSNVKY